LIFKNFEIEKSGFVYGSVNSKDAKAQSGAKPAHLPPFLEETYFDKTQIVVQNIHISRPKNNYINSCMTI